MTEAMRLQARMHMPTWSWRDRDEEPSGATTHSGVAR